MTRLPRRPSITVGEESQPEHERMTAERQRVLRILSGDLHGQEFLLQGEMVLGRATTCHVFVPDRRASREHARVFVDDGVLFVEDLGSHNGTFVNGQRIGKHELQKGDLVRLGVTQFTVDERGGEDTSVVRVISDSHPMTPLLVRQVEPNTGRDQSARTAEQVFDAIGVGHTMRLETDGAALQLLRKTRHFAILTEASSTLQRYNDLRDTLPGLFDLVLQVMNGDRTALLLLDEQGQLVPKQVRWRDGVVQSQEAATLSKTVADYVLQERCAVITADASADARFATAASVVVNNLRSLMAVPVLVGDRMLGLLEVENRRNIRAFDEDDLQFVTVLGSMVGVALDNLEMSRQRERAFAQLQAAQEQLLAAQERLVISERMGMLGRLASGITHEVKNHLSPFMLADMIRRKYPADQEIQEASELMLEAQQRILGLVDEIRLFAHGGQAKVDFAPADLAALVENVVRFIRCDRTVRAADLRLSPLARPIVVLDSSRIRQVLINLIRNAADAQVDRPGGVIDIRVLQGPGDFALVEVQDNGPGVAQEIQSRIFEPFFTTKGENGLGLGLDICRQIVGVHNGRLEFHSQEGLGTVFRMFLPLLPPRTDLDEDDRFDDLKTDPTSGRVLSLLAQGV